MRINIKKAILSPIAPGVLLVLAALLAVILENSPLYFAYDLFKQTPVVLQFGEFVIDKPLLLWINDGLMAVFFLLIGLEIKREFILGHLSQKSQIILPVVAAIGGLVTPALIYLYVNSGHEAHLAGWAIPTATDIAFVLGVLLIFGNRIPQSLKVCLVAIAIIDDLAAIIIIAIFYTADLSIQSLCLAAAGLTAAYILNRRKVSKLGPYCMLGLFIWACVLKSGVHATLAGVALGLIIPLKGYQENEQAPLIKLEHALHPWVSYFVLPLFAFVNAGVPLAGLNIQALVHPVTLGIALGLFLGKQIGVMSATFIATKLNICRLPAGVNWKQFYGLALLTGIGFTMSLFVGTLAFHEESYYTPVRLGVILGSLFSGLAGGAVLFLTAKNKAGGVSS